MEPFLFAVVCIAALAALAVLDVLAIAFGAYSRDGFRGSDWEPPSRRGF